MKCFANRVTTSLLNIPSSAPVAVTTNGTAYRVLPEGQDRLMDDTQDYRFVTNMDFAGGASTPTAQIIIQGSVDNVNWMDLAPGTVRSAAANYKEACLLFDRDPRDIHGRFPGDPEFSFSPHPDWCRIIEMYCPSCATMLDVEYLPPGHPPTHDIQLDLPKLRARHSAEAGLRTAEAGGAD